MKAKAVVLSLGFHLCIDAPGQNLLLITQAVEDILSKVQNCCRMTGSQFFTMPLGWERGTQELPDGGWRVVRT